MQTFEDFRKENFPIIESFNFFWDEARVNDGPSERFPP